MQLPRLQTPANSLEVLAGKMLTVVLHLIEGTSTESEAFAYCNLTFEDMKNESTVKTSENA